MRPRQVGVCCPLACCLMFGSGRWRQCWGGPTLMRSPVSARTRRQAGSRTVGAAGTRSCGGGPPCCFCLMGWMLLLCRAVGAAKICSPLRWRPIAARDGVRLPAAAMPQMLGPSPSCSVGGNQTQWQLGNSGCKYSLWCRSRCPLTSLSSVLVLTAVLVDPDAVAIVGANRKAGELGSGCGVEGVLRWASILGLKFVCLLFFSFLFLLILLVCSATKRGAMRVSYSSFWASDCCSRRAPRRSWLVSCRLRPNGAVVVWHQ